MDAGVEVERRSTNLELFVDLAFVFAISQLSHLLAADLSPAGVAKAMLVAWTVWWVWSQFTWLGTAVDLERDGPTMAAFLVTIVPVLFMASAIPDAYAGGGRRFGLAVLVATLWSLVLQGLGLWGDPRTRPVWIQYASVALIAPLVVGVGGLASGATRVTLWCVALVIDVGGAVLAGRETSRSTGSWRINASHFAERHALFVIIVLGEVLVAVGSAATGGRITVTTGAAVVASTALAAVLWWSYFGFVSGVSEERLRTDDEAERGHLARDLYSFGHFPLVAGIACVAVVAEAAVAHPDDRLGANELGLLVLACVLMLGAYITLRWRIQRRVRADRFVMLAAAVSVVVLAGPHLDGWVTVSLVALVLGVGQAAISHGFTTSNSAP